MTDNDILVLGGGMIGTAIAEELARRGRRVTVLEQGTIGCEASTAAAGILSAQMDIERPGPLLDLCQASRRIYPGWARRLESASKQRVGWHEDGILWVAFNQPELRRMARRAAWQRRRGLPVETWSAFQIRHREPVVSRRVAGGFFFPTEAQLDNVKLMRALAIAARKAGVTIREGIRVSRVRQSPRGLRVETSAGVREAKTVINCLGSWAPLDGLLPRPPIIPARGQILCFDAPKQLFRHVVMSDRAYGVQRRDGRLIVGSTVEFVGYNRHLTLAGIQTIMSGFEEMTDGDLVGDCTLRGTWAGLRPYCEDQLPMLGPTSIPGLLLAAGHFRHGILLAPITATLIADVVTTDRCPIELVPFLPSRFSRRR